jgi:hypothetical protein
MRYCDGTDCDCADCDYSDEFRVHFVLPSARSRVPTKEITSIATRNDVNQNGAVNCAGVHNSKGDRQPNGLLLLRHPDRIASDVCPRHTVNVRATLACVEQQGKG